MILVIPLLRGAAAPNSSFKENEEGPGCVALEAKNLSNACFVLSYQGLAAFFKMKYNEQDEIN